VSEPQLTIGVTAPPPLAEAEAAAIAARLFGVGGTLTPLPSERDQNFLITDAGGRRHVLKIANPAERRVMLEAQNGVMLRIADHAPGLVQVPLPARGGELMATATVDGRERLVRMLTYLPGRPLGDLRRQSPRLNRSVGEAMARIDDALDGHDHEAFHRRFYWDLEHAPTIIAESLDQINDTAQRDQIARFLDRFHSDVAPRLAGLRAGLIHGDPNEYNLLVDATGERVSGVLDLGDMVWSRIVYDPAIAAAYAITGADDALQAVIGVAAGYHTTRPLHPDELAVLHPLACARLCQSVCVAAVQQRQDPSNRYLSVSQTRIHATLPGALEIPLRLAEYALRDACGLPAIERAPAAAAWVAEQARPMVERRAWTILDRRPAACDRAAAPEWSAGRHDEPRYLPPSDPNPTETQPTIHLGTDLTVPAGTEVMVPLDGSVRAIENDGADVILAHPTPDGELYTIVRGLAPGSAGDVSPDTPVEQGRRLGTTGTAPLRLQLALDLLGLDLAFPELTPASLRPVWAGVSPDPSPLVGLPSGALTDTRPSKQQTLERRRRLLSKSLSLSYKEPLKIVRGDGAYLIDETGRRYLDCVNNVAHVGHSNPRVVAALTEQATLLNTNTRYLHDAIVDYAEALVARLPSALSVCFFMNSGSEANDLALRIARTVTGRRDVVTLEGAYHGNSQSDIEVSPYKYHGPGGAGPAPWVHEAPMPDPYRGRHPGNTIEAAIAYASDLADVVAALVAKREPPAAFICEPIMSCAGQIEPPPTFLSRAFDTVRGAGGLCIADEVQVGFGRVGDGFWAFETQGVTPDIVTLGKPIGNGHPMAAVVTTAEIAEAFANGMEYFSTFGGNPVSAAVGLAVLREIDDHDLQENARVVGGDLLTGLRELMAAQPMIGDCRGRGLFLGIELVRDRTTKEPAPEIATHLVNRACEQGVLLSTDGPDHNVIKIKPPLVFGRREATHVLNTLQTALSELA
jgi:4-aminobutyrate aminotransferase-like enzyme/Ser/Thr protein kinase RdoA (MazF antagonist)